MKRVLFVCSQNKLRSPTAEQVFAAWEGIEVSSAGLNNDAVEPLTADNLNMAAGDVGFHLGEMGHLARSSSQRFPSCARYFLNLLF